MKLHSYLKKNRLGIFYYRIQWRDESGKRRETCASLHTRDPDEARALSYMAKHEIAALEAILAGMQPKPEIVAMIEREKQDIDKAIQDQSLTLQEAIDQFLLVEKGGLAASTKKAYKTRMEMLTKHVGPKRGLGFIRKPDVVKALEASTLTAPHESKRHTATEGRLNHTTIKNALTLWIEFFDWCRRTDTSMTIPQAD